MLRWAVQVPAENHYTLNNANVPVCLVSEDAGVEADTASVDHTALLDIEVLDGTIASMAPAGKAKAKGRPVDCAGRMVWPTFVDLHTHIGRPCPTPLPNAAAGAWGARLQILAQHMPQCTVVHLQTMELLLLKGQTLSSREFRPRGLHNLRPTILSYDQLMSMRCTSDYFLAHFSPQTGYAGDPPPPSISTHLDDADPLVPNLKLARCWRRQEPQPSLMLQMLMSLISSLHGAGADKSQLDAHVPDLKLARYWRRQEPHLRAQPQRGRQPVGCRPQHSLRRPILGLRGPVQAHGLCRAGKTALPLVCMPCIFSRLPGSSRQGCIVSHAEWLRLQGPVQAHGPHRAGKPASLLYVCHACALACQGPAMTAGSCSQACRSSMAPSTGTCWRHTGLSDCMSTAAALGSIASPPH